MSWLGRLFGWSAAPQEAKAVEFSSDLMAAILTGSWGGPSKSGASVSTGTALQCPAFWRGINVIANGIRQLPFEIYRPASDGRGVEPATDHPLYYLLRHKANGLLCAADYWGTVLLHAAATGHHVSYRNTVSGGKTVELIPVRPDWMHIEVQPDFSLRYHVTFENGSSATLTQDQVFHVRGPSWDGTDGLSPVDIGREAIGLAMVTEETHARFHANGARPSGVLQTDTKVDDAVLERLRAMFAERYAGTANAAKPMILQGGLKWQQVQMTGVDSQHLETRKHQVAEIARLLGLWPIMLGLGGDESPTFASAEMFAKMHVIFSLQPWLTSLKGAIETQLLTEEEVRAGYHVRIDTSELVRGSLAERTAYYKAALGTASSPGWLTQNEIREDDGWNPLDNPEADGVPPPPQNNPQGGGVAEADTDAVDTTEIVGG